MEQFLSLPVIFFGSTAMLVVAIGLAAPDSFMEAGNGWLLLYLLGFIGYVSFLVLQVPLLF